MKKLTSLALSAVLAASAFAMTAIAAPADDVVQVNVMEGLCTLADNASTNADASGYALCFAEAYGTGRTTQGDAVTWENVTFDKDVKQVAIKCGYNLGGDKAGTATEFWLYLNDLASEPIAKVTVSDAETASSQIKDQIYKFADVDIKAGTYNIIVEGQTKYSGSVSQINFMYKATDAETLAPIADAKREADLAKSQKILADKAAAKNNIVQLNVMEGLCTLADNATTNADASGYALCFAEAYGTGRTTQGDAVTWEKVKFEKDVAQVAIKCGYNLGGDKAGTATEFWLYLNNLEGDPIAKVTVSDAETASSQIKDQVYKVVDFATPIAAGEYTVIIVGETQYSGSVSQINFMYDKMDTADKLFIEAADAKRATDLTKSQAAIKKAADEAKKAREEAKKAEEEAKKAEEEAKKAEEEAKAAEEEKAAEEAPSTGDAPVEGEEEEAGFPVVPVIIVAAVIVIIAAVVIAGKKKKA